MDRVISDFIAGAAERLVRTNEHRDVIVVEGQGSLYHPRYFGVTLGLLHGLMPDGLIHCYEMSRTTIGGLPHVGLPSHSDAIAFYETCANVMYPCRVIGVAVNGQRFTDDEAAAKCERVGRRLGLPACDVIRHGPCPLVEAVIRLKTSINQQATDRSFTCEQIASGELCPSQHESLN